MVSVMGFATCSVFLLFFFVFHLVFLINPAVSTCPKSFNCGFLGPLEYPLANYKEPDCGLISVNCSAVPPKIQLGHEGVWYEVRQKISTNKFGVTDTLLLEDLDPLKVIIGPQRCSFIVNRSLPQSPLTSFSISPILKMFSCTKSLDHDRSEKVTEYFKDYKNYSECEFSTLYYKDPPDADDSFHSEESIRSSCSIVEMPVKLKPSPDSQFPDFFQMFSADFELEWKISDRCVYCHNRGKKCVIVNNNNYEAQCQESKRKKVAILASSVIVGSVVLLGICILFILYRRKKRNSGAYLLSRNISSDPSSKTDMEGGNFYFGIPIFSYKELEEATNHFDSSRELGDGGFGTVYYGKLRDGREVAIKRLYEHNCRRVEQFLNEIKILTCLRHPNLVSLYGCTSRKSRDLLLVYEYIPNGTVADHLHGERAKEAPLTWPVRMSIAIETANALAYLHKSDIIHRDVKTNNILLDSSFCVKVADFGLSRLFPNDVSHISTAPQGTPGYVDPEYHQCYQLTDKSDVYSFGVVLIELISSMPAVDITRHRHEINLANLAVNRIQQCEFDELIDQSLGYDSDAEVTRMTTSVAELAFRCLQLEKDMRPSMDEVLAFLKDIQEGGDCKFENAEGVNGNYGVRGKIIPPSPETDDVVLLKNKHFESSPVAVTDAWVSSSSTTTSSIG